MKSSILSSIATILYVVTLFRYGHQMAFASAFTAITDVGKELAKTVLSHPLNTLTGMRRGLGSSVYGLRSTIGGYIPRSVNTESALSAKEAERYFKREQKLRAQIVEKLKKKKEQKSKLALRSLPEPTDFILYWRGAYKSGFWFYRMYTSRNASKKFKKAEEARKQEYFCGNNEEENLKGYCTKALSNTDPFFKQSGWVYDATESPKCELRNIILEQYDYESQRGVLACPVVVKRKGEADEHNFVYISSIDDPPKNRLSFYVFTEADESLIDKHARKFPKKDAQSEAKFTQKNDSRVNTAIKTIKPAMSVLRAIRNPNKSITKSLLLPASTSAVRAIRSMGTGGIMSYMPFMGSKKVNPALPLSGKLLKVVSLVVDKKAS